jgi:hypothetical protein
VPADFSQLSREEGARQSSVWGPSLGACCQVLGTWRERGRGAKARAADACDYGSRENSIRWDSNERKKKPSITPYFSKRPTVSRISGGGPSLVLEGARAFNGRPCAYGMAERHIHRFFNSLPWYGIGMLSDAMQWHQS